jgi:sphingolipid delta-4 desaturase
MATTDFEWTYTEEPHRTRRQIILKAHPEIKKLFGHHTASKYYCAATVFLQICCAIYCAQPTTSWFTFFVIAYVVGGTANHSLTLAIHEMSHNLFFADIMSNVYYSYFANFPLVIPYSASFKKYHLEHHRMQGVDGIDTDIPTAWEGGFFTTPFRKFLWVLFQPFFYALRPLIVNPKPLGQRDVYNICTQVVFLYVMHAVAGWASILYLLCATFFGLGLHPCAGHFIAEHYTNLSSTRGPHQTGLTPIHAGGEKKGDTLYPDETFTYRGPLNLVSYYVGIHVAHHDFPNVSGFRLREIEKLAPEFYDHLPVTRSWPGTIYDYITGPGNPFDRVKRRSDTGAKKVE